MNNKIKKILLGGGTILSVGSIIPFIIPNLQDKPKENTPIKNTNNLNVGKQATTRKKRGIGEGVDFGDFWGTKDQTTTTPTKTTIPIIPTQDEQIKELNKKVQTLEQEKSNLKSSNNQLTQDKKTLEGQNSKLRGEVQTFKNERDNLKTLNQEQNKNIKNQEQNKKDLESSNNELLQGIKDLNNALKVANQKIKQLKNVKGETHKPNKPIPNIWKAKAKEQKLKIKELKNNLDIEQGKNNFLKSELENQANNHQNLKNENDNLKRQNEELRTQNPNLKGEIENLKKELAIKEGELTQLKQVNNPNEKLKEMNILFDTSNDHIRKKGEQLGIKYQTQPTKEVKKQIDNLKNKIQENNNLINELFKHLIPLTINQSLNDVILFASEGGHLNKQLHYSHISNIRELKRATQTAHTLLKKHYKVNNNLIIEGINKVLEKINLLIEGHKREPKKTINRRLNPSPKDIKKWQAINQEGTNTLNLIKDKIQTIKDLIGGLKND